MRVVALAVALAAVVTGAAAQAQPYPNRPVTMIVPFPPGGIADITGRPLAVAMAKTLGQNLVVENKAGAGGAVGHAYVAKAKPDGYTIMIALSSIVVIPEADKVNGRPATYQMSDFTSIALISADPTILVVRAESPWKTAKEFIEDAKKRPGQISYSSSGIYGTLHMAMELLSHAAGIKLRHIPAAGAGPALTAILGGHVDALASGPAVVLPHIKSGKLRALAGWGDKRVAALPEVPTFKELGYPEAEFYIWAGLFAPKGTSEPVLAKLREATRAAVAEPEFKAAMDKLETPIVFKQGQEFQQFFDADARRLAAGVRKVGRVEDKK
jgi:tripartite-type tricarboxylate transporter receptor subunit TctC